MTAPAVACWLPTASALRTLTESTVRCETTPASSAGGAADVVGVPGSLAISVRGFPLSSASLLPGRAPELVLSTAALTRLLAVADSGLN
ncbi:hypothetical protein D9M72_552450 [compost metagenome]